MSNVVPPGRMPRLNVRPEARRYVSAVLSLGKKCRLPHDTQNSRPSLQHIDNFYAPEEFLRFAFARTQMKTLFVFILCAVGAFQARAEDPVVVDEEQAEFEGRWQPI